MEFLSTTALANELETPVNELFNKLKSFGWINRDNNKWVLTDLGRQKGGQTRATVNADQYVVWPENISLNTDLHAKDTPRLINATTIGKYFNTSSQRLNLILSELGWIEKNIVGWEATKLGRINGGKQFEHETSGGHYVLWPENVLINKNLVNVFKEVAPIDQQTTNNLLEKGNEQTHSTKIISDNFRDKFPATLRTKDGHLVRSKAEVIIDNALYDYKLVHAYERKLPIEEVLYSDFFMPSENVYIEYWGILDDPKYVERKRVKIDIYKKYDFKLIELLDEDISNLDDHLPKKLLKFGIKVYGN